MLKKAGIVVLGATAGMLSLAPLASAGEAPDSQRSQSSAECDGASARQGGQLNTGDQAVGVNNVNVQAPINQIGILSRLDSDGRGGDCGDNDRKKQRDGDGHNGQGHGGGGHDRDRDGGGARAEQRGQVNTGDQLIGVNNVNVQLPINQLGVLSDIDD